MTPIVHARPQRGTGSILCLCAAIAFLIVAAAMTACSTTEGFGKDVKHLGGDIEESAADNK